MNSIEANPHFFSAHDGIKLAYFNFTSANPRAIFLFLPCGGGYINSLYLIMGQQLEKMGFGAYLLDPRGHGRSEGERGDTSSKEAVWQDIADFIDIVKKDNVGIPIFISGHSIGAGLILNFLVNSYYKEGSVQGIYFLAPNFGYNSNSFKTFTKDPYIKKINRFYIFLNKISCGLFFKHSKAVFLRYSSDNLNRDPLLIESYSVEMVRALYPDSPVDQIKNIKLPFYVLVGKNDPLLDSNKLELFCKHSPFFKEIYVDPKLQHLNILSGVPEFISKTQNNLISH